MAKLKMKDYTNAILISPPCNSWGIQSVKIKGADLYPGHAVTQTGEAVPEVVSSGTANDVFYGVLLDVPDKGIDVIFSAGDIVPCALAGSGAAVWTWVKASAGALQVGTRLHTDAGTGVYSIIGENMLFENVGLVIEYSADVANDRPAKVVLSG